MQIIIVHPRLPRARTLTIRAGWLAGAALLALLLLATASGLLSYVTLRHATSLPFPFVQRLVQPLVAMATPDPALAAADAADAAVTGAEFLRQNIDALAVRLGELQARLARLDAIGERVGGMVGIRAHDLARPLPGRGGAAPPGAQPLSLDELASAIDRIASGIDHRGDHLSLIESELVMRDAQARLLPGSQPLEDALPGSRFGWRIDPFTGRRSLHEGIDFNAAHGTPIVAAGAGVVVFAGWHPAYGRQVDVDHGDGVVTRYAHASKLLVRAGDIVKRGQRIALVGSSGRSTGPHLHFEVRVEDQAFDPLAYLRQPAHAGRVGASALASNAPAPGR